MNGSRHTKARRRVCCKWHDWVERGRRRGLRQRRGAGHRGNPDGSRPDAQGRQLRLDYAHRRSSEQCLIQGAKGGSKGGEGQGSWRGFKLPQCFTTEPRKATACCQGFDMQEVRGSAVSEVRNKESGGVSNLRSGGRGERPQGVTRTRNDLTHRCNNTHASRGRRWMRGMIESTEPL